VRGCDAGRDQETLWSVFNLNKCLLAAFCRPLSLYPVDYAHPDTGRHDDDPRLNTLERKARVAALFIPLLSFLRDYDALAPPSTDSATSPRRRESVRKVRLCCGLRESERLSQTHTTRPFATVCSKPG
jgi:hypothetical protein